MTIWKNCHADIYYASNKEKPVFHDPGYEVRIDNDRMVVSYEGASGWVNYQGKDVGGGHFDLRAPEVDGHAMLHRAPESGIVEGNWVEGGYHGMWRIYLVDATATPAD